MRIAFLVQASKADPLGPGLARVTAETLARLRERGAQVDVLVLTDLPSWWFPLILDGLPDVSTAPGRSDRDESVERRQPVQPHHAREARA